MAKARTDYTLRNVSVSTLNDLRVLVALSRAKGGKYKTLCGIADAALAIGTKQLNQEIRRGG